MIRIDVVLPLSHFMSLPPVPLYVENPGSIFYRKRKINDHPNSVIAILAGAALSGYGVCTLFFLPAW
jgi:hypothetical protein